MLRGMDLNRHISREELKGRTEELETRLAALQRHVQEAGVPVIIVFEGWEASGKGTHINELIRPLDPRGFKVHSTHKANDDEVLRPIMWPFWTRLPARGRIAIFDRSWYSRIIRDEREDESDAASLAPCIEIINDFEKGLCLDGALIIKLFLHISQKEQKKRLRKLESNAVTAWRVNDSDWKENRQYDELLERSQKVYEATDTDYAPWCIVEAEDRRFARLKIFVTVIKRLEEGLARLETISPNSPTAGEEPDEAMPTAKEMPAAVPTGSSELRIDGEVLVRSTRLEQVDLKRSLDDRGYERELKKLQKSLRSFEYRIYTERVPVIAVFEGWDAAGKGGAIKRLTSNLDPRGYEVIPVAAPSEIEKAHHYLWRFWQNIPKAGHISIFDRSWYGRVLVERVEGFTDPAQWKRAYPEINSFERQLADFGTVLVKFWLHIDRDEQLRRFQERSANPDKQWKITPEDWRNRQHWDDYREAVEEMLLRTSTSAAPWTVVEANDKRFARVKVLSVMLDALEKRLGGTLAL